MVDERLGLVGERVSGAVATAVRSVDVRPEGGDGVSRPSFDGRGFQSSVATVEPSPFVAFERVVTGRLPGKIVSRIVSFWGQRGVLLRNALCQYRVPRVSHAKRGKRSAAFNLVQTSPDITGLGVGGGLVVSYYSVVPHTDETTGETCDSGDRIASGAGRTDIGEHSLR